MPEPALELHEVSAWYGAACALFDVSLQVRPGETVGLLGRNGAGKTTTLRAIMGVDVRRTGTIRLHGEPIERARTEAVARRGVAWVPEDRRIFPNLTVRQNLQLALRAAPKDQRKILPLHDILGALPLVEKLLDRKGSALSGGEQQAVSLARALAAQPRLLLLDEPTEGLAPTVVQTLKDAVAELPGSLGMSILLAEQNLAFVNALSDRVYVLDTGRLAYTGSAEEFSGSRDLQLRYLSVSAEAGAQDA